MFDIIHKTTKPQTNPSDQNKSKPHKIYIYVYMFDAKHKQKKHKQTTFNKIIIITNKQIYD